MGLASGLALSARQLPTRWNASPTSDSDLTIGFFRVRTSCRDRWLRQPDRLASSGARAKFWQQRVHRRFLFAVSGSVGLPVRDCIYAASKGGTSGRGGKCIWKILGVRIPLADEDEEPWLAPPSRRQTPPAIREPLPAAITVVRADQIYLPRHALPPSLIARLIRLAAFQNPEFYAAQAMRRSTHDKPRIISCAELTSHHVALPRGCFDAVLDLLASLGITVRIEDCRFSGTAIPFAFTGALRSDQETAITALLPHDTGVLAATTAFGKTILAIRMMAERGRNTLVLVHRRQLMDQWIERLTAFSSMPRDAIGMIGGGRRKPKGHVDVALIQSLVRKGEVDDIVGNYGHLVVDECHHLSAVSFELVVRRSKARYVLGLSATVTRKDGHHPIIVMQCGPVRHRVDARWA